MNALKKYLITYHRELEDAVGNTQSLLDVGCGVDSPIMHFNRRVAFSVGIDGFYPSIEQSRRAGIHDDYRHMELLDIEREFSTGEFDCVLAADVLEHFPKPEGLRLLAQMERIARHRIIVFTPNGFLPQDEHSDNPLQKHLSGWTVDEMEDLGYEVIGINGWRSLLGEFALPRLKPRAFWALVSRLTQPLVRNHPRHAFQLLCVKWVDGIEH